MVLYEHMCAVENISFPAVAPVREPNALCGRSQDCTWRECFNGGGTHLRRLSQPLLLSFPLHQIPSYSLFSSQFRGVLLNVSQG